MIKADHKKWAEILFDLYLKKLLKKYFEQFIQIGETPIIDESKSLVIVPNHFSWWDGFFIYKVMKQNTNKVFHIMMLEEELKRYWFFQKLGAYSIKQNNPKSVLETLNYTIELLKNKNNMTVIYPQGEIQPQETNEIKFNQGVNYICKKADFEFQILPVAFRIFYSNKKLPFVLHRFGDITSSFAAKEDESLIEKTFLENHKILFDNKSIPNKILSNIN